MELKTGMSPRGVKPPAYRMPDGVRLGPVSLQIADLERSVTFYHDVLGLRVHARDAGRVAMGPPETAAVVELVERPGVQPVPRRGRLGLFHVAYLLPDRASLARFVKHIAAMGIPVGMSDHLVSEAIYLNDPDGLGIEVYADRPRTSWRYVDGQMEMATLPLNVDHLLQDAGAETWSHAPAGTRVGHVHLHVGDLDAAARFYHEGLGLDKVVWNYPGALFLSAGGYHHHLGLNTWAAGAPTASVDDARLISWQIHVPETGDLNALRAHLATRGTAATEDADGFFVTDPWGVALHVSARSE